MPTITFRADVDADDVVEDGLDTDYYMYELDVDDVQVRVATYTPIPLEFKVKFDEEWLTEEDVWNKIAMEFDRPYRVDGGTEY